jgi:hypothetical protein
MPCVAGGNDVQEKDVSKLIGESGIVVACRAVAELLASNLSGERRWRAIFLIGDSQIDWARLYEVCVGMIGIQPNNFWQMSLQEIHLAIAGF